MCHPINVQNINLEDENFNYNEENFDEDDSEEAT